MDTHCPIFLKDLCRTHRFRNAYARDRQGRVCITTRKVSQDVSRVA